jgi:ATP-dependent Clp protease protease subunit
MPLVPVVIQQDSRGERSFDIYSRLLRERVVFVGTAIDEEVANLAGGAKGKRAALPNSRILIHQPTGGFQGQSTDIQIHAKESLALRRRIEEIYSEHTGHPREQVSEDLERDRFFTPEQALEYGMIDRVTPLRNGNGAVR